MEGMDAMCFWSGNHAMMFYSCAMFAGEMYPEDYFPRAGMTGRQLSAYGKEKLLDWLEDLETYGYEEFLSAVYMCVTFAALLNLVNFAEPEILERATKLCNRVHHQYHGRHGALLLWRRLDGLPGWQPLPVPGIRKGLF